MSAQLGKEAVARGASVCSEDRSVGRIWDEECMGTRRGACNSNASAVRVEGAQHSSFRIVVAEVFAELLRKDAREDERAAADDIGLTKLVQPVRHRVKHFRPCGAGEGRRMRNKRRGTARELANSSIVVAARPSHVVLR